MNDLRYKLKCWLLNNHAQLSVGDQQQILLYIVYALFAILFQIGICLVSQKFGVSVRHALKSDLA